MYKTRTRIKLLGLIFLIMMTCECMAIPADSTPCKIQQPDGTFVTLSLHGDEYLSYTTTADGFTVVKDGRGCWVYATRQADGTLAATSMVAHDEADRTADEKAFLQSTPRRLAPKMESRMAERRQGNRVRQVKAQERRRAEGYDYSKFRGLIILVEYNDREFMYGKEMNSIINDIANKENYKGDSRTNYVDESKGIDVPFYGSVYDYFRDNSGGMFRPKFDVVGPVKVNCSQYFANGMGNGVELATMAIDAADPLVDYSQYDGDGDGVVDLVFFIYAGYGSHVVGNDSRLLWPHQHFIPNYVKDGIKLSTYACTTEMERNEALPILSGIGSICHEFSHVLGLPDFYDVDYEASGGIAPDPGIWSLMASGNTLGYGRCPCNLSLYERFMLCFLDEPTELNKAGTYSMHDVSTNEGFWLATPEKYEFFIFENRQQTGWDSYLTGHGMMAYRVDLSNPDAWDLHKVNVDPTHMHYETLYACGYLGGNSPDDPFPGKWNVTMLTNHTQPSNLRTWSGQECRFALAHIAESDGIISFDLVDASTFKEIVMPQTNDMYEGVCYHLAPGIYMPKATYQTSWTSDNPKVARVDQDGNVTALAEGKANIILTVDGSLSDTCTVTVVPAPVVPNIGSLNTVASNTDQVLQLNNTQVFFTIVLESEKYAFLRDGTGSILFNRIPLDVVPGDVLNGRIYMNYVNDGGWMTIDPCEDVNYAGSIQVTHGPTPEPEVVTLAHLSSAKIMDYITLKGVTLNYRQDSHGEEQLCIVDGEHFIILNTLYDGGMELPTEEELAENRYDVEAIISYYNIPGADDIFNLITPPTVSHNTGIAAPDSASQPRKGRIYNLMGQRLNALRKGLNIVDGKKVEIK